MPRPSRINEKRRALLPRVALTFAEWGYRRTTTAELAARCGVQENILYRLWPDKKAMFVASIAFVLENSLDVWKRVLQQRTGDESEAERLLAYESVHHGEHGLYRILFAALGETDDPDIAAAAAETYRRFHGWIVSQIEEHRRARGERGVLSVELAGWALVGLGTAANIGRELGLLDADARMRLLRRAGRVLLDEGAAGERRRGGAS